jgi:FkbM family methyltransferase
MDGSDPLQFLDAEAIRTRLTEVRRHIVGAARSGALAIVGSAALPQKCATALARLGRGVDCFIEYDARFWGREVSGRPVVSIDEACDRLPGNAVIVSGVWSPNHVYMDTRDWLRTFGFTSIYPVHAVFWAVGDDIGPHYQLSGPQVFPDNRERIARVYAALADEESRQQFLGHLKWRVTLEPEWLPVGDRRRMYFDPALFELGHDAVIADCGAFDGDSLRVLLFWHGRKFKAFHAFEPDPITFARLQGFIRALPAETAAKVHPVQMALGKDRSFIHSAGTGMPGSRDTETATAVRVPVERLDVYFKDLKVDYLKLDIEGAEWEALEGGWSLVERDQPIVGVAVYHRPDDIFALPEMVMARTPGYSYFLRSHDQDGIDVVFYAVPPHRRSKQA